MKSSFDFQLLTDVINDFPIGGEDKKKDKGKEKKEREERGIKEFIKYKHSWITVENMDHYKKNWKQQKRNLYLLIYFD